MNYECPFCHSIHSGIEWDSTTMQTAEDTVHDIESIEMHIPGYSYICPTCGAETTTGAKAISNALSSEVPGR